MSETNIQRTTGHAWVDGRCVNCGAGEEGRPFAESCPSLGTDSPDPLMSAWDYALTEAFHAWDHAGRKGDGCPKCSEFLSDFGPLFAELVAPHTQRILALLAERDALAEQVKKVDEEVQ